MDLIFLRLNDEAVDQADERRFLINEQSHGLETQKFFRHDIPKQSFFDWVFGVILPVICFAFDPIVFRQPDALLGGWGIFAYTLSYVSIMSLMAFMLFGNKLGWINAVLGGLFGAGALISLVVGLILLPFSLLGLLFLIGALGFTPLFTARVYWRNAKLAFGYAKESIDHRTLIYVGIISALFSFTVPYVLNTQVNQGQSTMRFILHED